MKRQFYLICFCAALATAGPAGAQDPVVEIEFEKSSTIPGQPLALRVTVLVPTWLTKPVIFPSFEAPNILVHLSEGSTGPTSKTIEGETWSGVSRRYQITPMVPGRFEIPAQQLQITWAEPGQTEPKQMQIALDVMSVEGVVPEGAEGLSPFIAADKLTLDAEITEAEMPMAAGDSITVSLTAQIEGTSAMFLPQLLPSVDIEGIAAYPAEPIVSDNENRGRLSGRRIESVSLLAQSGGSGAFPRITVQWYNLKTKKVETATIAGFDVSVDAPEASEKAIDPRLIALCVGLGLLGLVILSWSYRYAAPRLRKRLTARRNRLHASEAWAYGKVVAAEKDRDISALFRAIDVWAVRCVLDPREMAPLNSALFALGSARYGRNVTSQDASWLVVKAALPLTRSQATGSIDQRPELPPLNSQSATSAITA